MFPLALMTIMDDDDRNYMITIYERYQWLMIAIARRYVQTSYDQEEIISEACLALIKKIPTLQTLESEKLPAYIATTVKNKAYDYLARQNTRKNRYIPIDSISYVPRRTISHLQVQPQWYAHPEGVGAQLVSRNGEFTHITVNCSRISFLYQK